MMALIREGHFTGTLTATSNDEPYLGWWAIGTSDSTTDVRGIGSPEDAMSLWEEPALNTPSYVSGRFVLPGFVCAYAQLYRDNDLLSEPLLVASSTCAAIPGQLLALGFQGAADTLRGSDVVIEPVPIVLDQPSTGSILQVPLWRELLGI